MAETPRNSFHELPMFTRASDLQVDCWARWFLSHYETDQLPDAGFYILGTVFHEVIEEAILNDRTDADTLEIGHNRLDNYLGDGDNIIWSKKRNADTVHDDLTMLINNWFDDVHPDSAERMPVYRKYQWPPLVEYPIEYHGAGKHGLFTTPDAIFKHKTGRFSAVVDWKTGATAKADPIQLQTYSYALRAEGFNIERAWFHHTAFRKTQEIEWFPPDAYIEERIRDVEITKETQLFVPKPDWYCDYCRAQSICPVVGREWNWDDMMGAVGKSLPLWSPVEPVE